MMPSLNSTDLGTLSLARATEAFGLFRCASGLFYDLLGDSLKHSWREFCCAPGKIHHCPNVLRAIGFHLFHNSFCFYFICIVVHRFEYWLGWTDLATIMLFVTCLFSSLWASNILLFCIKNMSSGPQTLRTPKHRWISPIRWWWSSSPCPALGILTSSTFLEAASRCVGGSCTTEKRVWSPRGPTDDQETNSPRIKIINSLRSIMAVDGQKTCSGWKQSRRTEGSVILRGHILAALERAALAGSSVCGFMLRQHSQWTILSKRFFQLVEIYSRRPPAPNIWKHRLCIGQRSCTSSNRSKY